ncbi:MAG: hypothetical protein K2R98_07870 [Gemmataceae bacterium]|nr:hypothetical protein [Gemmataceae bacterium]
MKSWNAPSPEQLAAFVDGELDATTRASVAVWLEENPEAVAELDAQRRLERLVHASPPPEPSEAEWAAMLDRIVLQTQVHADAPKPVPQTRRPVATSRRLLVLAMTAAATVLIALSLRPQPGPEVVPPQPQPVVAIKTLPVASDEDVEIVSVDAADIQFLVVGEPPMRGLVVLAAPGDVVLDSIEPDPTDGMMPKTMGMDMNNGNGPMIVAPLSVASSRP